MEFPKTLKRIGYRAYYYSEQLEEVDLPYGLEEICYGAFQNTDLVRVTIPYSVREIQSKAFDETMGMLVTLPGSVEKIGAKAFYRATIYTPADRIVPEGWYIADRVLQNLHIDWDWRYNCNVVYGCALGDENGIPYVQRTGTLERAFADVDEHIVGLANFDYTAYAYYGHEIRIPYREGYTFKGWATEENGEIVLGYELYTYKNIYGEVLMEYYGTLPLTTLMALDENIAFYAVWEKES